MRKKLMTIALAGAMLVGGVGAAQAAPGDNGKAGPNGNNDKGLCTAYFNGQKNGHNKDGKASPTPFAALEEHADEQQDRGDGDAEEAPTISEIYDYCSQEGIGIGGNPDENGRFTTCFSDDDEDAETHPCDD